MNMKPLMKVTAALGLCLAFLASAAAEKVIRVATWLPPTHVMNTVMLPTWGKWVEEATEGRVTIKIEHGMGHPKSYFDLVEDGVVEATWVANGYVPGRFKLPEMAEIPGFTDSGEINSIALWRIQTKYFNKANEFEGLTLLSVFTHGPGYLHTKEPVANLAGLKNKKIRVGGTMQKTVAKRLDTTPVSAPAGKVYEMLQQGIIDGVFLPMGEQKSLRLYEVSPNVLAVPGGTYYSSFSMVMNTDFFDGLSQKDRDAIMSVSGEKLAALGGRTWDENDDVGLAFAISKGVKINDSKELGEEFKQLTQGLDKGWIEYVKDRDIDAEGALKEFSEITKSLEK